VHTVAELGAVRRTTYWVGATLGAAGALHVMWMLLELTAAAFVAVDGPTARDVDEPAPPELKTQAAYALDAPNATAIIKTRAPTTRFIGTIVRRDCFGVS
jgi:hypothetical protein